MKKEKKEKKKVKFDKKKCTKYVICGLVVLIIVMVLIIAFGTSKKVTCTMTSDQSKSGYTIETVHVIKARGGIVRTVSIKETITSSDQEKLDSFEKDFIKQYEYNKKNYGGYKYKVTKDGNTVKTDILVNYHKFDMRKFVKSNPAMEEYTKSGRFTLRGAIALYESTGAVCK